MPSQNTDHTQTISVSTSTSPIRKAKQLYNNLIIAIFEALAIAPFTFFLELPFKKPFGSSESQNSVHWNDSSTIVGPGVGEPGIVRFKAE